jgi:hypothetical protein
VTTAGLSQETMVVGPDYFCFNHGGSVRSLFDVQSATAASSFAVWDIVP